MNKPFGEPGIPSNRSTARKQGIIGTSCNDRSKVWFSIASGIVSEVYYPALAVEIVVLVCAALWAKEKGEEKESKYLFEIADYWAARVEDRTFTDCGCIFPEHPEHYQRIASFAPEALEGNHHEYPCC